ncbi:MAG: hypothetical protein OEW89_07895 [Gammaproteobacteria bacterium]|nr:hypothetical protein [Gammaproteobacteria bacterium]MDH5594667.1 hypothetical protein [Gammaproteobacteria bacterium]MDH5614314.1 hypothetical protein [Gammaproteobacteria bacterium]
MRVTTTDPISLHDVSQPEVHPFVIEGKGESALKIYFENEKNKRTYLDRHKKHSGKDFRTNLNKPV